LENTGSSININMTYEDITDYKTKNYIIETLKHRKDLARNVNFEITETENIENYKAVKEFIREVKEFGSLIFIDDFGTGYSNFEKIIELDIDVIKIDGSIIKKIENKKYRYLIKNIKDLGKNLGIKIVAEHVETSKIQEEVKKMGIEMSQGYFIGKPTEKINTNKIRQNIN
ncbi:EAL domain-containing protein, partial [Clostridium cochlearium]|uniref:EAL domain-containing protein n=1 Tax=Clostridium cochlearium TaxID=1494 RepID=UPI0017F3F045